MVFNFNADVGEGAGNEELLMPYIHSCNIACGAHAGSLEEMENSVKLAIKHEVKIGAHPSFEDRQNFGRLPLSISSDEIHESVKKQILLLQEIVMDHGSYLNHVKPHGALYHQACADSKTAEAIVRAAKLTGVKSMVGLPDSILEHYTKESKGEFIAEGFADRRYDQMGSLLNRKKQGAVITNKHDVLAQVRKMLQGKVTTAGDQQINLQVNTICFHGDTKGAVELIKYCHEQLI